ncbi:MAG: EF-P beta-lysylation protein EpmB [Gammaproteobacteria bacterium]|nr:EF-P beta-lysylation protein EpmB [Gammaproteobacteria bacterium]
MIPESSSVVASHALPIWQKMLNQAFRDPEALLNYVQLNDPARLLAARQAAKLFPLLVPQGYAARMRKGDPNDPLLRQVLPLAAECETTPGFSNDPVGDLAAVQQSGILRKYHGRALLISTGACAIHCRYCFRRSFPYNDQHAAQAQWQHTLTFLRQHNDIEEVILSGGDPLSLSNQRLAPLLEGLATIPHIKRLRLHSRLAVVLPERIDTELLQLIAASGKTHVHVIHANHANEINHEVVLALRALRNAGAHLYNQTVLLRGVNDSIDAQVNLAENLFAHGVQPYYLHLLDRVQGAQHFEVPEAEALALWQNLQAQLPGYLLPRLVREIPGELSKTWVAR